MKVFDIPVLFQATGLDEDEAAEHVAYALGHSNLIGGDSDVESWHMPEHQSADGSDSSVRIIVVGSIRDFRIPNHVKDKIEKVAAIIAETE